MNAYSVDVTGLVVVASKNVATKTAELQKAMEELAIAKILSAIKLGQIGATPEKQVTIAPVEEQTHKCTRVVRFKKTGYTVASNYRRKLFLARMQRNGVVPVEQVTFEFVKSCCKAFSISEANFRWAGKLSDVSILGLYNFIKAQK
jgi:hypothetical protein